MLTEHVDSLRRAFSEVRHKRPFRIDAIVILPEHLHCLWTLPEDDRDFSSRWQGIKWRFSRALPKTEAVGPSRKRRGERGIWQRRFWEHAIRDEEDFNRHLGYIHYNPVKHGHVPRVLDWPYSSLRRFVERGLYPEDWAAGGDEEKAFQVGEP